MASKINVMALVMVLSVAIFFNGALGQSSCMTTLVGLSPCLNYVSGNSSTPSSSCCTSLAGVVQSNPQCLCMLVNGGGSNLGIAINQTLALGLPSACNLQTPPLSRCNAANGPTASVPASSPTGSTTPSDSSNEIPATPSGTGTTGSKTVPSTPGSSAAAGSNTKVSMTTTLVGLFLLFVTSSFALTTRGF
ncbi:non-specific lipid transfer protein GPI-anchored 5 [Capsicum chacoense]|uniref:non-specific lipid transfer protein GPI-anchored 5 n=1 Tax=Capsicum annuum TaxID=4072 RepID=UPI0007BFDBF9|nr:non-specific lipid transfer protein GPI-anchored 5 [Capsicum annuum]KAF3678304.1 Bifunctional inhibitor/lipid-transfer protein/seed storage 2S albumin superfamily protein, putative isoform 1 [Capsicum annuum]KAF3679243.1 Bifunctional inhibitor/lipid-transfer protein/seed storage 2S albumin superfamily protein, putative isoform 1 [Capsicum annuum]